MPRNKPNKTIKDVNILGKSISELKKTVEGSKSRTMVNENIIFDKNRKLPNMGEGNRFLIMRRKVRKAGDEESMQKVNPIMAGRLIRGVGSVIDMKLIRDGGLLIRAKNYKAANSIYQIVKIPGFEVEVAEYTQLNKSVGVIFDRSLVAATDDEILKELEPQKCTKVRRIQKTQQDGSKHDTGTFFLTFGTVKLPASITIGYSNIQLTPFVPNPTRCFKCQRFGHVSVSCKSTAKIYVNCGREDHVKEGEKCRNPAKCMNCDSSEHNSMARECPEFLYRKKIEEIKVHEQKSHVDATRLLDARDPMARPTKKPRTTFASTLRAAACTCGHTCGAAAAELREKRKHDQELVLESDEEALLKSKQTKAKKSKPDIAADEDDSMDEEESEEVQEKQKELEKWMKKQQKTVKKN